MATSAPATLQDLGASVLGDHALHLQQEVVFGAGADRTVTKTTSTPARRNSSIRSTW